MSSCTLNTKCKRGGFLLNLVKKSLAIILAIVLLSTITVNPLRAKAQPKEPGELNLMMQEIVAGMVGAYLGGNVVSLSMNQGLLAPSQKNDEEDEASMLPTLGLGAGIIVGATSGVVLVGSLNGVQGNLFLAPFGAGLGFINAVGAIYLFGEKQDQELSPISKILITTGLPAFGATLMYNVGAKLKEDPQTAKRKGEKSVEFSFPILRVIF